MEPRLLGTLLKKFIKSNSIGNSIAGAKLLNKWERLLPPVFCNHSKPIGIKNGELLIEVDSSPWLNEFTFLKKEIKKRLNEAIEKDIIKEIRFYLKED